MPDTLRNRLRLLGQPSLLILLSTTMASIAATGVVFTLNAAFEQERAHTVVCSCECGDAKAEPATEAAFDPASLEAKVEGELDRELIRSVVRAHVSEVRACYTEGLAHDPTLEGTVVVTFTIDPNGHVVASSTESTLPGTGIAACIGRAVQSWVFPKPNRGHVLVTYPFHLSPG